MGVVRVPRQHTVNKFAQQVLDALRTQGEPCFVLHMFHAAQDAGIQPRCHVCYNEIYKSSDSSAECTNCFGTSFEGGVRDVYRTYGIFTDNASEENKTRRGEWTPDDRNVQLSYLPGLIRHDYILRVSRWGPNNEPLEYGGYYVLDTVRETSVRDGSRFGQTGSDRVALSASLHLLGDDHIITNWLPALAIEYVVDNSIILPTIDDVRLVHPLASVETV